MSTRQDSLTGARPDLAEQALDAVAAIVRTLGKYAFDTERHTAVEFAQQCEAWARHVLIGAPVDGAPERVPGSPPKRAWADLFRVLTAGRQAEHAWVKSGAEGYKTVVFELLEGLRSAAAADDVIGEDIVRQLARIEEAVRTGSMAEVSAIVPDTVSHIRRRLDERRGTVRRRLTELTERLKTLRHDLAATKREAETDPLTGLYNRGAFNTSLEQTVRLCAAAAEPLALLVIDLDHFKAINDTYGHSAGDEVLREAAERIAGTFPRKNDFVARYGGEEFAVLLRDVDADTVRILSGRLLRNIRGDGIDVGGETLTVTASAGSTILLPGDTGATFFARADGALYDAKRNGRDRAAFSGSGGP